MDKKILLPIVGVVVVAVIIGVIAIIPGGNAEGVEAAFQKMSQYKSFEAKGEITANITADTDQGKQSLSLKLNEDVKVDQSDKENIKSMANLDFTAGIEGISVSAELDLISIGKDYFAKIVQAPMIPYLGISFDSLKGEWINMSGNDLVNSPISEKEILDSFNQIVVEKGLFKVKKDHGMDEGSHKYTVEVKKDTVKSLIPKLIELTEKSITDQTEETKVQIEEFKATFEKDFDNVWTMVSPVEMDVWINGDELQRVIFVKDLSVPTEFGNTEVALSFDFSFSGFNESFEITAPLEYRGVEEILNEMFQMAPEMLIDLPQEVN